jgi:hypothetical protein
MESNTYLSAHEFRSLIEVGKGFAHGAISEADGIALVGCGFAYKLLGQIRITTLGRARLKMGE